jgi:hypothetical protein
VRSDRVVLCIGKADGAIAEVPMRYNGSHQRGYRCFIGPLADAPEDITEDTPHSFEGRSLFDALAVYRATIEPDGWRLLHAAARADAWPDPKLGVYCVDVQILIPGVSETVGIKILEAAPFDAVATLENQRANFEAWMASLSPVPEGRVPPRAGHEHDEPRVDFGPVARLAGRILRESSPEE